MTPVFINDFSIVSRLGLTRDETRRNLTSAAPPRPDTQFAISERQSTVVAALPRELPSTAYGRTRTNQIASILLSQIDGSIQAMRARFPAQRIAGVIGTSTTGIEEAIAPLSERLETGNWNSDYRFSDQELGDTAMFLKSAVGLTGPCFSVSTACTSGSKALAAGARLIQSGIADTVVCGGVDSVSRLTTNGFAALDSVSPEPCLPFSVNRQGINIGEGGALFLLSNSPGPWRLEGWGESSDAYHLSSPDPSGAGAEIAVNAAFARAGVSAADIGFVHLHGTATLLNDAMEAALVDRVFGAETACASTKGMTGHTLGAAGALQLAVNLLAMEGGWYPPHVFDGACDPALAQIRLAALQEASERVVDRSICLSYAFGGSNVALIAARG